MSNTSQTTREAEDQLNGSAKVILFRIKSVEGDVNEMKTTLQAVRDHQLMNPPCPRPGLCVDLATTVMKQSDQISNLRWYVAIGIGVAAAISIIAPLALPLIEK